MSSEHIFALPTDAGYCLRHYELRRLLGYGNFGLTYLAYNKKLGCMVAVKEMLPFDFAVRARDGVTIVAKSPGQEPALAWARERFYDEAKTLAKLQHPSILPVFDYFEGNGTAYLISPFIEGETLEDWFNKRGPPTEAELCAILRSLLNALKMVHEYSFLHRDIKPENILMDRRSGAPVLIDFGNARVANGLKTSNLSAILTPGYAPFEQYQTDGKQGAWTDLYALGAVLYRAVTGKVPPWSTDRQGNDTILRLANNTAVKGYSQPFLAMIDKALRLRREERWQTCTDWLAALDRLPPPGPRPPRRGLLIVTTIVALLALAGGGAVYWNEFHNKKEKGSDVVIDPEPQPRNVPVPKPEPVPVPAPVPLIAIERSAGPKANTHQSLSHGQTVDFGQPTVSTKITETLLIRNIGQAELSGLLITKEGSDDFSVAPLGTSSVAAGKNASLSVSFTPRISGRQQALLHIASNSSGGKSPFDIHLSGGAMGVPDISIEKAGQALADNGPALSFGTVEIDKTNELKFTLKNIGSADLTGFQTKFEGEAGDDYSVTDKPSGPLAPGASAAFTVVFKPRGAGERPAILYFVSNAPGSKNPFDLNLLGKGYTTPPPTMPPPPSNQNIIGMKFADVHVKDYDSSGRETADLGTRPMSVYEVTKQDYKAIVPSYVIVGDPREPVLGLSDEQIDFFLSELSRKDGHTHRLPTDHEWSCAIGLKESSSDTSKSKSARNLDIYPWLETFDKRPSSFNYKPKDGPAKFVPVEQSGQTQFGLFGMGGNAAELCTDGTERVLRGGSAYTAPKTGEKDIEDLELLQQEYASFASSNRQRVLKDLLSEEKKANNQTQLNRAQIGFRCVREP